MNGTILTFIFIILVVTQRGKIARMCALYKAYTSDKAWKAIGDRLQAPSYLNMVDHY